jgi:hypothetical protein
MQNRWQARVRTLLLAVALSHITMAAAQRLEMTPTELAWIGLFNNELLGWLENENRLDELCTAEPSTPGWHECRVAKMEPKVAVIPVRSEPHVSAKRLGEILLVAMPGKGLRAFASADRHVERFTPDLYDSDWGYGPFFHQTILARRGTWCRVPVPSMGAAWVNAEDWMGAGSFDDLKRTVSPEDIITSSRGDMFVLGVDSRALRVRPQQKRDMWCEGGEPPPLVPWQETRIPFEQLFDSKGHLLIGYKYKRGC